MVTLQRTNTNDLKLTLSLALKDNLRYYFEKVYRIFCNTPNSVSIATGRLQTHCNNVNI